MFSKKSLTILLAIFFIVGILIFLSQPKEIKEVVISSNVFPVEVARTEMERERGLSLHVPLQNNEGMFFIFEKEDLYGFWMKDMLFPIDILWIDSNLKIIHIEKNISPETYPKVFSPTTKSLYVLEIKAGQTEILNIKIGDEIKIVKK